MYIFIIEFMERTLNKKLSVFERISRHKISIIFVLFVSSSIYYDYSLSQKLKKSILNKLILNII